MLHEYAHLAVALPICGTTCGVLTRANFRCNVSMRQHFVQLLPCGVCESSPSVSLPGCASGVASTAVALAGIVVSAMLVLAATLDLKSPVFLAAFLNLALALSSDGCRMFSWVPCSTFGCGNWGLLCPAAQGSDRPSSAIFPPLFAELLKRVLSVVELRGAQAGGFCTYIAPKGRPGQNAGHKAVVTKFVKHKRGKLVDTIFNGANAAFAKIQRRSLWGYKANGVVLAQGHSRFGTSSVPAVVETHPHHWVGESIEEVWTFDTKKQVWKAKTVPVTVTITHNGDFDAWQPYEEQVGVGMLGLWLERVLCVSNDTRGDSAKLCGTMDLLVTKGTWLRSVRYAYALYVMTHVEQVSGWERLSKEAPNKMPEEDFIHGVAQAFTAAFKAHQSESPAKVHEKSEGGSVEDQVANGINMHVLIRSIVDRFLPQAEGVDVATVNRFIPEGPVRETFVSGCVHAFFQQDTMAAVYQFFRGAQGTFGCSMSCSLNPGTCILAAKGQPVSMGFNCGRTLAVWSSEPASLGVLWPGGGGNTTAVKTRFDINDAQGEIIEIHVVPEDVSAANVNDNMIFQGNVMPYFELAKASEGLDEVKSGSTGYHILLRACSMDARPEIHHAGSFGARLVSHSFARVDSPLVRPPALKGGCLSAKNDCIADDIKAIPGMLRDIDRTWKDARSLNCQSAVHFADCVLKRALEPPDAEAGVRPIDVLVTGVEGSHWVGQQFVADLARLFPSLHVQALSSNFTLGLLMQEEGRIEPLNFPINGENFQLADGAVCLVISQSGTTYPSVWASRWLAALPQVVVFAMSGHFDTVLAASIGQSLADAKFGKRCFSNMSGIRPAEPSTVATVAMQHTLTQLLLVCARQAVDRQCSTGGHQLTASDVRSFQVMSESLASSSEAICGVTVDGDPLESETYKSLLEMGKLWSHHLTEGYWATLIGALYVYVTVTGGWPPVTSAYNAYDGWNNEYTVYVAHFLDATIYVFLAAIICVIHRLFTGRRLLTRYCARTIVICDSCTLNYKLLRAYVSKLRSLAFRFTTFGVIGQNGTDHFVHEMTHLTTSDVIIAVGRPDGRLSTLAGPESSMIMSMQQAKFIKKPRTGIEAFSIGHNPWTNPKLFTKNIVLPQNKRPKFLSEQIIFGKGGSADADHHLCQPSEVLEKLAAIRGGHSGGGNDQSLPILNLAELQSFAGGQTEVGRQEAKRTILKVLKAQQDKMGIQATDVDMEALLPAPPKAVDPKDESKKPGTEGEAPKAKKALKRLGSKRHQRMPTKEFVKDLAKKGGGIFMKKDAVGSLEKLGLSDLMTICRGPSMKMEVVKAKKKERRRILHEGAAQAKPLDISLQDIFFSWRRAIAKARPVKDMLQVSAAGEWRQQEAYRTAFTAREWVGEAFFGIRTNVIFEAWLEAMHILKAEAKGKKQEEETKEEHIVGAEFAKACSSTKRVLNEQRLMENLYETRIAHLERLMGFLVLFHHMVKPISYLPFLGFNMDRTESRLRVASTPAPTAMREKAPAPPRKDGVSDLVIVPKGDLSALEDALERTFVAAEEEVDIQMDI